MITPFPCHLSSFQNLNLSINEKFFLRYVTFIAQNSRTDVCILFAKHDTTYPLFLTMWVHVLYCVAQDVRFTLYHLNEFFFRCISVKEEELSFILSSGRLVYEAFFHNSWDSRSLRMWNGIACPPSIKKKNNKTSRRLPRIPHRSTTTIRHQ